MIRTLMLVILVLLGYASASDYAVIHEFALWGTLQNRPEKLIFYQGWTNGFLPGRGNRGLRFANCMQEVAPEQAIAMISKRYKNHPEKWSRPLTEQVLEALTASGAPCEGKNPLQ